jgi:hypothetical protein
MRATLTILPQARLAGGVAFYTFDSPKNKLRLTAAVLLSMSPLRICFCMKLLRELAQQTHFLQLSKEENRRMMK